jgi:hypothetical protein
MSMLCIYGTQQQHMHTSCCVVPQACAVLLIVPYKIQLQSHEHLRHQVEILIRLTTGVETLLRAFLVSNLTLLQCCGARTLSDSTVSVTRILTYLYYCCLCMNVKSALSALCCRSCCCYDGNLEHWTIVILTPAKFKSRTFSVLDLAFSSVSKVTTEVNWTAYKDPVRTAQ